MRARRVKVPEEIRALDDLGGAGYADAFEVAAGGVERSAEAWAREVFEGLASWQRVLLVLGWRVVMGFGPGPADPAHVLGWRVTTASPASITLEQVSSRVRAHVVLKVSGAHLVLVTLVRRENPAGRLAWLLGGPVHRRVIPFAMGRAVARRRVLT